MDERLVAWGRRVKARGGLRAGPTLWLFTDAIVHRDLPAVVGRLPRGLCGVVLRHDGDPDRAALVRSVARVCRERRLALSVAGDWRLAWRYRAGLHLRDGRRAGLPPPRLPVATASAHKPRDVRRASRTSAGVVFVSPVFATESHPAGAALGVVRWAGLTRVLGRRAGALGGVDGVTARRLHARVFGAIGAIRALS